MKLKKFTFNYFSENTYVIYDETKKCAILDPGCCNKEEESELEEFIASAGLEPVLLLNTHCHIDHILGNSFVSEKYSLGLFIHKDDLPVLKAGTAVAGRYGIPYNESPLPTGYLEEGKGVEFGNTRLEVIHTPGHSPGSVCFINTSEKLVIGGDVLFRGSIGRTDLPGGDFNTLKRSIQEKVYLLPDEYTVYSGHGDETSIGQEKNTNPFVKARVTV